MKLLNVWIFDTKSFKSQDIQNNHIFSFLLLIDGNLHLILLIYENILTAGKSLPQNKQVNIKSLRTQTAQTDASPVHQIGKQIKESNVNMVLKMSGVKEYDWLKGN